MSTATEQAHQQLVREVAELYRQKDFGVEIQPDKEKMPSSLQEFQPDLIVAMPQNTYLYVEVRRKGDVRGKEYWQHLRHAIAANPNWQLQIVVRKLREEELLNGFQPLLTNEDIEKRLEAGNQLAQNSLLDSALVVTWQALEALLRKLAQKCNLESSGDTPATLITRLVSEGNLGRDNYDVLMSILSARNQAAHGHIASNLTVATFDQAQNIARRLLKQQRRAA